MRLRPPLLSLALIIVVAACSQRDPVANNLVTSTLPAPVTDRTSDPAAGPPADTAPMDDAQAASEAAQPRPAQIPAALHGRWGLAPADCTSALGDAKGLLVVSERELRFYESRAVPSPGAEADEDSITGNFRFTGEGQTWTKFETLQRRKDKLIRIDSNPTASYSYVKC
jgi:hypothetical protein